MMSNPTPTQQSETLLPCPFCGVKMIRSGLDQPHFQQWWEHEDRETSKCVLKNQTISDASKVYKVAWNTRAAVAGPRGDVRELGADTNFPLSETLRLLVEWAQHLHGSHECDCDGWEQRSFLIEAAQRYQHEIAQAAATSSPAPAESVDDDLLPVAKRVLRWLYATMNPTLPIDKSLLKVTQFDIHAELERAVSDALAARVHLEKKLKEKEANV